MLAVRAAKSVVIGHVEIAQESPDMLFDVVADQAHRVQRLPGRVGQGPFLVTFLGIDRAGIAAAHGYNDVGGLDDLIGPRLGKFLGDIDAHLGHCLDGGGIYFVAGFGSARPGHRPFPGQVGKESARHLGAPGVVGAQEQHYGFAVDYLAFHSGCCVEALAGKAFGEHWQVSRHCGPLGELVVARVEEPFDRLYAEHFGEIALQVGCGDAQRPFLQMAVYVLT